MGAAGTVFEQLVHLFWKEATNSKDNFTLLLMESHDDKKPTNIKIDCKDVQYQPKCIEDEEFKALAIDNLPLGYFVPSNPYHPDADSLLRYKVGDEVKVLSIQLSIAQKHGCKDSLPDTNLLKPLKKGEKPKLAMWDFPVCGRDCRKCIWSSKSDKWHLCYIRCEEFEKKMTGNSC